MSSPHAPLGVPQDAAEDAPVEASEGDLGATPATTDPDGSTVDVRPAWWEWLVLGMLVVTSGVVQVLASDDLWFTADFWGLATHHAAAPWGWFEPHAGHLVVFHTAAAQAILAVGGIDGAAAWHVVPRVVVWMGLCTTSWWVWRRRGADAVVALAAAAVLVVYAGSGWLMGWLVGSPIAFAAGLLACWLVARPGAVTWGDRTLLAVLLVTAAMGNTAGLLGAASVCIAVAVTGRLRAWWPSVVVVVVAWAAWRVFVPQSFRAVPGPDGSAWELPLNGLRIAQYGLARLLTVPPVWGWVAIAVVVLVLFLAWTYRRGSVYDLALLGWMAAFVIATTLVRIDAGPSSVTTIRYGYALVLLTLALVVPHLRVSTTTTRVVVVLLGLVLVGRNAAGLLDGVQGIEWWTERSQASRGVVTAAATMLVDGEPAVDTAPIDYPRAGMLTVARLREVVDGGWDPQVAVAPEVEELARGDLRVDARPFTAPPASVTCGMVPAGAGIPPDGVTWVVLQDGPVRVETADRWGRGVHELTAFRGRAWRLEVAPGTAVRLVTDGADTVTTCR